MKSVPKVAVITRTKDRPAFLERAMQSVLQQTMADWVHVIVNDGGDPAAVDLLVKAYGGDYEGRVIVVHHDQSKGMQNASNAGIAASDSTYLVIHDDDDSWYPDFLEETVGFLEEEGPDSLTRGVVVQTTQVFEEACITGNIAEIERRPYYPFDFVSMEEMRKRNLFAPIAFLYRRTAHDAVGLFRQEFDVLGDHDFNLRFLRHFEIGVISTFHAYYHWRHGSHGNTVTRARGIHRRMLSRLKNAYHRDLLDDPANAVGDLEEVEFPERDGADPIPFRLRKEEPQAPRAMPDFQKDYAFKVLSLDVFETVLRRRCDHPLDAFKFLEDRAVREAGLPAKPYMLARQQAERLARLETRPKVSPEVSLKEIYKVLARLLGLKAAQRDQLMKLELQLEKELLYGDPRWIELYATYRKQGTRIVFVSDMYHDAATVRDLLAGCGFPEAEVFVSSEHQASKHDGDLQPIVTGALGVEPGDILHVGDNFNSDYQQCLHAGWQVFHWSGDFRYQPFYRQVEPFLNNQQDLLSLRIMGEVERIGLTAAADDLLVKLGREVAGPLYLSYMRWVVREARRDGIRKLLLIGRDGFYWERTLRILAESEDPGIEFAYLHSSRKVYNFASFHTLDKKALTFLMTPNPALRVVDFIDRTGLQSGDYTELIQMAGFPDPEEVLTNEMGGRYLDKATPARLETLFRLLKPDLERLFARDRAGTLKVLEEAGYSPEDCAFVDIGWNGSCVRPVSRLLGLDEATPVKAYFFGTWKEAGDVDEPIDYRSFFIHFSEPQERFQLVRESVNLIEALHAAPYPTLLAFSSEEDGFQPVFSSELKSGFSEEQQERLWHGSETFLKAILEEPLPVGSEADGLVYLQLALSRFLREPSPHELETWGSILHSDGFGLEVYKPLIEPVTPELDGEQIMEAYRGSSWRRGFLASISDGQRQYVLERIEKRPSKSFEQLQADLDWKTRQADQLWEEKERWKWEADNRKDQLDALHSRIGELQQEIDAMRIQLTRADAAHKELDTVLRDREEQLAAALSNSGKIRAQMERLQLDLDKAAADLEWEKQQYADLWGKKAAAEDECEQLKVRCAWLEERINGLEDHCSGLENHCSNLQDTIQFLENQVEEAGTTGDSLRSELESVRAELGQAQADLEWEKQQFSDLWAQKDAAEYRVNILETAFTRRGKTLKALFSGKAPPIPGNPS